TVPETQLAGLRAGEAITAHAAAFPGETFAGTIASIDPSIDPASRAVLVRAILPNPGARLKPGMLMNVSVRLAEREAPAVPEFAIAGRGEDRFVFIVTPEGKAKRVPVRTGLRDAGLVEVSGVPAGARVIGEGLVKVADGMKVRLGGKKGAKTAGGAQSGPAATRTAGA
ncbi:MAG: efflux RND transporter periplasmic adaptor subunit, partial [Sphingomonadales bacterium]|nr:efflux RND transporter periplasmic adaptor subunit [Sphingomonadales bacterium]